MTTSTPADRRKLLDKLPPAPRSALVNALGLTAFTLAFTALMAFAYEVTFERIEAAKNEEEMRLVNEVLPKDTYDNNLLKDFVDIKGSPDIRRVWRARQADKPVALVVSAIAPDGYGGPIELIISLSADGKIGGVRVKSQKETPGLGDYIDVRKDRNKKDPWVHQFIDIDPASARFQVKKDGGDFTNRTGATVSPRAVIRAIGRAAQWTNSHRNALFSAQAETHLDQKDGRNKP